MTSKRTCVMCGDTLGKKSTYTGALIFGNKSRDPHVGPYCENCGPPAIAELGKCVRDCPLTDAEWIPVKDNCIEDTKNWRKPPKCEFSLGMSPIRHGVSCIHPVRLEEKRNRK